MTTMQGQIPHLNLEVADDTMEISSDYGNIAGNDDIDIDIDLTNDQVDEDHIIEDAQSDIGYEEIDDDLMVDDDQASHPMDDVDDHVQLDAGYVQMEDAHIDVNEASGEAVSLQDGPLDINLAIDDEGFDVVSEIGWDEPQELEAIPLPEMAHETYVEQDLVGHLETYESAQEPTISEPAENKAEEPSKHVVVMEDDEAIEPVITEHMPTLEPDSEETKSKAQSEELETTQEPNVAHHSLHKSESESAAGKQISAEAEAQEKVFQDSHVGKDDSVNHVVVLYQGTECALIGAADNEDLDSFFFRDNTVTREPLITFFNGLREILQNDIPENHELCLMIDDLGIEISETTASNFNVTFAKISELHADLKQNDDSGSLDPMFVTLTTKIDSKRRISILLAGALEGKGLSEFLTWEGESFDGDEESVRALNESDHNDTKSEVAHDFDTPITQFNPEPSPSLPADVHTLVNEASQETAQSDTITKLPEDPTVEAEEGNQFTPASPATENVNHITTRPSPEQSNVEDEDDLLDYDEEEVAHTKAESAYMAEALALPQLSNENGAPVNNVSETSVADTVEPDLIPTEEAFVVEEASNQDIIASADGETVAENSHYDANQVTNEDIAIGVSKHEDAQPDASALSDGQDIQDDQDEIDFGIEPSAPTIDDAGNHEPSNAALQQTEADEIGYDEDDSEPTLVGDENASHILEDVEGDEIDYDEDDDDNNLPDEDFVTDDVPGRSSPSTGKRSHAEVEDVDQAWEQQDAKRIRS